MPLAESWAYITLHTVYFLLGVCSALELVCVAILWPFTLSSRGADFTTPCLVIFFLSTSYLSESPSPNNKETKTKQNCITAKIFFSFFSILCVFLNGSDRNGWSSVPVYINSKESGQSSSKLRWITGSKTKDAMLKVVFLQKARKLLTILVSMVEK